MLLCLLDPARLSKAIILDSSPIHPTPKHGIDSMQKFFETIESVNWDDVDHNQPFHSVKESVDIQLSSSGVGRATRNWLLMNIVKGKDGRYGWQINYEAFRQFLVPDLILVPERERWTPFDKPVQFFGGAKSGYIPEEAHGDIRKVFPQAGFDYISNSGHHLNIDNPEELKAKVLKWLRLQQER